MKPAKPSIRRVRVLIVDDHPMTRAGLAHMINHQTDMLVSGEAENAGQALAALEVNVPDLVLLDITLPDKSGWK
jgi:YesN/AraC family two-component response regulator